MTRMQKADIAGWIIALFVVVILVTTFLTTPSVTTSALAGTNGGNNKTSCDGKTFVKYMGIGKLPILARAEVRMHACWRHANLKVDPGKVMTSQTKWNVSFYNTANGDTVGARWNKMETWRPSGVWQNRFRLTKAQHVGMHECLSILGQLICGPTADFSLAITFNSPYISNKSSHSDGSLPRWDFNWFQGEPGQNPGSFDDNLYLCETVDC